MSPKTEPAIRHHSFAKLGGTMDMPDLLAVQKESFAHLLQADVAPEKRDNDGLQAVFQDVFPITDVKENYSLEFVKYSIGEPKYTVEECQERDMTYAAPLKATLRLVMKEEVEGEKKIKAVTEKEVFLGEVPLLTDLGTFVINGAERVIVSQLHRSPGVVFEENVHPNGQKLYSARIIPFRGSWVEFTVDIHDVIYVHIDKKKKFPVTALLRAFGWNENEEILKLFYSARKVSLSDVKDSEVRRDLLGSPLAADVVDEETGEILYERNTELSAEVVKKLRKKGIDQIHIYVSGLDVPRTEAHLVANTLRKDPTKDENDALQRIYSLMRSGEAPNLTIARDHLERLFFDPKRYDLGRVGRYKLNQRLELKGAEDVTVLRREDFVEIIKYLIKLRNGLGYVDDIDHLGNRRVRSIGELIANQFSLGLSRMARLVRERMTTQDPEKMSLDDLVNARTISAVINAFFGSSQLSQFMDQTNPLAEMTHKRRLSALGPGGLTRERAGFEVRDVHYSHYGRMCPIETPEGPNIGLITSLSTYARINELGFIETPYRKVEKGRVTGEIVYLSASEEDPFVIAQASAPLDEKGRFVNEYVLSRLHDNFPLARPDEIDYMDVSPEQLVSIAAALIPFLDHDDANRALMGSNMQRQAVPLLRPQSPVVGTGLEGRVAVDSGAVVTARRDGVVEAATADRVIVRVKGRGATNGDGKIDFANADVYELKKFRRTNQDTAINQRPIVRRGDKVKAGQVLADGAATEQGRLALGVNTLVAFMPWYGSNFEDAIILSERLVKDDTFTSVHIQELELHVRDTKRGQEEITREVPNVAEEALVNLDDRGIIRIGASIKPQDILVGKVSPKGEKELSPEERLLTAIFGEKAKDVKDTSLKAPPGLEGVIIDVKVFSRNEDDPLTSRDKELEREKAKQYEKREIAKVLASRDEQLAEVLIGATVESLKEKKKGARNLFKPGTKLKAKDLEGVDLSTIDWDEAALKEQRADTHLKEIVSAAKEKIATIREKTKEGIEKITQRDDLPPGVVQLVKVYVAQKRRVSVGDKMAGRHGNKGIVARIVPEEDMPFLPDGTPVEIVLNPLGVPSRMNVGQILETHLGWAAQLLGFKVETPVFHGATEEEIDQWLEQAKLPAGGKTTLYDGTSGRAFDEKVTVGCIYMMKLSHLVDDKIHARSIGPYSLVTQQPLAGKAQFGGQRFGEMEVWALEAYGAAHTLQEILTVKSDDVQGRSRVYEAIVKGENLPEPGVPESFRVLVKELQSLGLSVELGKDGQ
ncbi:MAG TPA: DNA-directed RNA polymerase subunit beta [Gemmatimonadota bacterium]|nr:DNA-directed RNA polymerase subunit beta [Gemmatimonadota bacterium]